MRRLLALSICLALLAACASRRPGQDGPAWPDGPAGRYGFDWKLSGDRAVAPLQVFDDGRDTWLQFTPGQPLPAIFGQRDGAERLLSYQRRDPYVRIAGVWPRLVLRGGGLQARAESLSAGLAQARAPATAAAGSDALPSPDGGPAAGDALRPGDGAQIAPEQGGKHARLTAQAFPMGGAAGMVQPEGAAGAAGAPPGTSARAAGASAAGFEAGPGDGNMRRTLVRWAGMAGWTFQPEHWAIDVDIPLTASARFPADFKQAVRQLLAATELSDRPAQPCFYSNRVLRVVSWSEPCDRTVLAGAGS